MMEGEEYLVVPKERIAVIIGPKGETKKHIENKTKTKIKINSKSGEVEVEARGNAVSLYIASNIIRAIGRGFSPEHALYLLGESHVLEIIDLTEILGKSEKALQTKRGRIIGKKGKIREEIEKKTQTFISVYGKTVGIIGEMEKVQKAKEAIEMLLNGATHDTVKRFLGRAEREERRFEL